MTLKSPGYVAVALAAGAVFALGLGIRQAQPLFISAINSYTALGYVTISLAFAVGQLVWGIAQPVAGAIADRHGPRRVMVGGALLVAFATAATPFATTAPALILLIGVLAASGAGAIGPSLLMSAANRWIPEARRAMASGIVNAGGSFGQFTLIPLAQLLIGLAGWQPALMVLGATGLIAVPLILWLTRGSDAPPIAHTHATLATSLRQAVTEAAGDRSYLLLNLGFFTCGFHVAFIATHLPGIVATCELPPSVSAWSLAIIGLFNIAGSLWIGRAIQEWRMKLALSGIYAARAALILVFFYSPKVEMTFFLFAAGIGFTYLSTVPPTVGLVAKLHGPRYLATLFGIVMLSHQVGGFLGAWLGGKAFEATGGYDWMWWADIALCLMAAVVHLPIREARTAAPAAA
ncbi:MAG: MFS transporter [Betaproteobacteria bacterium RIFCSPLOWO2_12_FULL_67_28]|nr:MAG: MFS transporter [Betaproteobacteria bacterium RIFCSPLOWO2_02_FULL_68_150]OGA72785.1 MAG: MFS transporter [Betaproteobacteria bacterium RIFCSPLOWO2_12_FULL_67_28]